MQIQFDDIAGRECLLRQVGEEELVDEARTRDPNWAFLFASLIRGHDHTIPHALRPYWYLWAIVEAARHLTFWTLLELIWWKV